jgi:MinD-like ATPase involved in chromosome partitioning or flagellar assembly
MLLERFDVATGSTDYESAAQTIYDLVSQQATVAVICFLTPTMDTGVKEQLVGWLDSYMDGGYLERLYYVGAHPNSIVQLPASMGDLFVGMKMRPEDAAAYKHYRIGADGSVTDTNLASPEPVQYDTPVQPVVSQPPLIEPVQPTQPTQSIQPVQPIQPAQPQYSPPPESVISNPTQVESPYTQYSPPPESVVATSPSTSRDMDDNSRANIIWTVSGKGGTGKTTLSILTAIFLASFKDTRVLLVDANLGQADVFSRFKNIATNLQDPTNRVPDISLYRQGSLSQIAVTINRYLGDAVRPEHEFFRQINLDVVFGSISRIDNGDRNVADNIVQAYRSLVDEAKDQYDYVVVDTQIIEPQNATGLKMVSEFELPGMSHSSSYVLAVVNSDTESFTNTFKSINILKDTPRPSAIKYDRILGIINRVKEVDYMQSNTMHMFSSNAKFQFGTWVPEDYATIQIARSLSNLSNSPQLMDALRMIRRWASGGQVSDKDSELDAGPVSEQPTKKRRLFGRK